jgi:hypothetical protein
MNNRQIAKNSMYKKMLVFFANPNNSNTWANFPRITAEISNFTAQNTQLDAYIQQHAQDTTGVTSTKNNAYTAMVNKTVAMAQKAYVWAIDTNNTPLEVVFDVKKSNFHSIVESIALAQVKNIRDAIATNVTSMTTVNLQPGDVSDLSATIQDFEGTIGTPGAAQNTKSTAVSAIETLMHPMDESLDLIERLIISQYNDASPNVVKEFLLNRHIDSLPVHHSGIHAHITDFNTNANLQGALLSITDAGKTTTADINGIAEIIKVKAGDYNVTLSMAGYLTQTIQVTILKGKIATVEVGLKK